jgi:alkylhydroperoxidase family enzyme
LARRLGAKEEWIAAARIEAPEQRPRAEPSLDGMRHWNEGEIVEITMVIGLFAYFNRFNDALRVEVTR